MKFLTVLLCFISFSAFASSDQITHDIRLENDERKRVVTKLEELGYEDGSKTYIKTQINYQGELIAVDVSKDPFQD